MSTISDFSRFFGLSRSRQDKLVVNRDHSGNVVRIDGRVEWRVLPAEGGRCVGWAADGQPSPDSTFDIPILVLPADSHYQTSATC